MHKEGRSARRRMYTFCSVTAVMPCNGTACASKRGVFAAWLMIIAAGLSAVHGNEHLKPVLPEDLKQVLPEDLKQVLPGQEHRFNISMNSTSNAAHMAQKQSKIVKRLLQSLNLTADPCDDFYQYACGKWILTSNYSQETPKRMLDQMSLDVDKKLRDLLQEPYNAASEGRYIKQAKHLYQSCVDLDQLQKLGAKPLQNLVNELGTWPLTSPEKFRNDSLDLESTLVNMTYLGLSVFLSTYVSQKSTNTSQFVLRVSPGVTWLKSIYLLLPRNSSNIVTYEQTMVELAQLVLNVKAGPNLNASIARVLDFERELIWRLANRTKGASKEKRIGLVQNNYTISSLNKMFPQFNWEKYFRLYLKEGNMTLPKTVHVVVDEESYVHILLSLITEQNSQDKRVVPDYLLMRVVLDYFPLLSADIRDRIYDKWTNLTGQNMSTELRWKECVELVSKKLQLAVGSLYVHHALPAPARKKAMDVVDAILISLVEILNQTDWMDNATRQAAQRKASKIHKNVGYPDVLLNKTALEQEYKNMDYCKDQYFQNMLDSTRMTIIDNVQRLGGPPPNKSDWSVSSTEVNAFYDGSLNRMILPAAILQDPFFGYDYPISMIFGGIGSVIGHELTHGFDTMGRCRDEDGNLHNWWSNASKAKYNELAECFVRVYSNQTVHGIRIRGNKTLDENIADNGGIKAAFKAFQNWEIVNRPQTPLAGLNLTHSQLFFVNFAQAWCSAQPRHLTQRKVLFGVHSPECMRVLMVVANSWNFAKAFNCPAGSNMNPTKKCELW